VSVAEDPIHAGRCVDVHLAHGAERHAVDVVLISPGPQARSDGHDRCRRASRPAIQLLWP
jgi:hypothetical protein